MLTKSISRLWLRAWSLVLLEMSGQEIGWLLRPREHLSLLSTRRTTIIVTRVRLIAGLFAVFTPLWIIADISAFPSEVWHGLAAARLLATAAFVAILVSAKSMDSIHNAYRSLAMLLAVPMLFFLFSYQHMAQFELHGFQAAFSTGYAFLPFVVVAGLSIFPLTLIECICYAAPMLALQVVAAALRWPVLDWPTVAASIWLLMLITAVSALAGLSQLAFMIVLVREAIHDSMTGCFSRHSGEELLELQFILAKRSKASLSLAFIDLDHFKQVNDTFGHDAGDAVLINATASIRDHLRMGDMLIRWGGEEFLLIMPNTDFKQALAALNRVRKSGFGKRPDGTPVTASIGLAELSQQDTEHWRDLVELSDNRMYQAKESGRDRIVAGN
ncbi:MAG TPA: GGDEF domain-containing protein [Novimethylophilus sp.]